MTVCIDKNLLGTKTHLLQETRGGFVQWVQTAPEDAWVFPGRNSVRSIECLGETIGSDIDSPWPAAEIKSFEALGVDIDRIPWHMILFSDVYKDALECLLDKLWDTLDELYSLAYGNTFVAARKLLMSLSRSSIDAQALSYHTTEEKNPTIRSSLRSFTPDETGFAQRVDYNQGATVTGRMTVRSGPQILTLPARCRDIISSRHGDDGQIIQIDFVSLEPRVALSLAGLDPPEDIYKHMSEQLFGGSLGRDASKLATICALYGASKMKLSDILGPSINPAIVIKKVAKYFSINFHIEQLKNELRNKKYITNHFGRKINPGRLNDNVLLSNYIQSTSVDLASHAFWDLYKKINDENIVIDSIFIIHDALVVDVKRKELDLIRDIVGDKIDTPLGKFPIKIESIASLN
jgi:hypothetical protein